MREFAFITHPVVAGMVTKEEVRIVEGRDE